MPYAALPDASIYYEEHGSGYPVLAIAPGGLGSQIGLWGRKRDGEPQSYPNPVTALARDFRVVTMDQRNAGRSMGEVGPDDGWDTYTGDQLALMDHLGIDRFHVIGACIGGPFGFKLAQRAPERVSAFVVQATIGLHENAGLFQESFASWKKGLLAQRPEVDPAWLDAMRDRLYASDFVFAVDRPFVQQCPVPLLVLRGGNAPHPAAVSDEIAALAPHATLVRDWDGPENSEAYLKVVREFLLEQTPALP
ncbi:MAG: alpha/beta hydrolase [Pseudomonadota bacterium]